MPDTSKTACRKAYIKARQKSPKGKKKLIHRRKQTVKNIGAILGAIATAAAITYAVRGKGNKKTSKRKTSKRKTSKRGRKGGMLKRAKVAASRTLRRRSRSVAPAPRQTIITAPSTRRKSPPHGSVHIHQYVPGVPPLVRRTSAVRRKTGGVEPRKQTSSTSQQMIPPIKKTAYY